MLSNVVVVVDGVELVAVQDEGFACALCLNSEEVREEVGRVEVRGCGLFGSGLLLGFLFGKRCEVQLALVRSSGSSPRSPGSGASGRASGCSNSKRERLKPISRPGPPFCGARAAGRSRLS